MTWSIDHTDDFNESLHDIQSRIGAEGAQLEAALRSRFVPWLDYSIQQYLRRKRDWRILEYAIEDFERKCCDPEGVIAAAKEHGKIIPDVYYVRSGPFFAFYYRRSISRKPVVTGTVVLEKFVGMELLKQLADKYLRIRKK